jgi:hypothetical protein
VSTAHNLPVHFVLLGVALELVIRNKRGQRTLSWLKEKPKRHAFLCDPDGTTLYILHAPESRTVSTRGFPREASSMWKKWSGFGVDGAASLTVSDSAIAHLLGYAEILRYRSDKWTGSDAGYEHKFTGLVRVVADSKTNPSKILLQSVPPVRLVTVRGIVG